MIHCKECPACPLLCRLQVFRRPRVLQLRPFYLQVNGFPNTPLLFLVTIENWGRKGGKGILPQGQECLDIQLIVLATF